jgi:prepilin-type processing-associated H-X9-DG protein
MFQLGVNTTYDKGDTATLQKFIAACKSIPGGTKPSMDAGFGSAWLLAQGYDVANTSYTHVMSPNGYSCTGVQGGLFDFHADGSGGGWTAAITATSNHPGGVNVGFCDGSVKFIKDTIALPTWWALGTRNLGEVVSADAY